MKQKTRTLSSTNNNLKDGFFQLQVLNDRGNIAYDHMPFPKKIKDYGVSKITVNGIETFQINIGKLCNQTCVHCHVDAGPDKKLENMDKDTLQLCLDIVRQYKIPIVDITGGAPEMNPYFKWFVQECVASGIHVISRCNLTIIVSNKKYNDLPQFYADHKVELISSLPYFNKTRTDNQRGDGVFDASIDALRLLNDVGYGKGNKDLLLSLVYNPSGAFLPGDQESLELQFKKKLKAGFEIEFDNLFCITNLPVSRFLDYLIESGNYNEYMDELIMAFNPSTLDNLMCRNTLSISWNGFIYDCDFNQMLDLPVANKNNHISNFDFEALVDRNVVVNQHCYGCTAGSGSSCGGEIA